MTSHSNSFSLEPSDKLVVLDRLRVSRRSRSRDVLLTISSISDPDQGRIYWLDAKGKKNREKEEISINELATYELNVDPGEQLIVAASEFDSRIEGSYKIMR